MKKNRKGFSLIELLAVIVILGILSGIAIPNIIKYTSTSRDKMYIEDAKRLMGIVKYKYNSDSAKIEKPSSPGDCIGLSFDYLDDGSFDNPPNKGKYEVVYAVIEYYEGEYLYYVTLIEHTEKDEYKGFWWVSDEELENEKEASGHIENFTSSILGDRPSICRKIY